MNQKYGRFKGCRSWWLNQPIWKILVKYSQIGNLPQIGVKIKNIWNHHLVDCLRQKAHGFHITEFALAALLLLHVPRRWGWSGAKPGRFFFASRKVDKNPAVFGFPLVSPGSVDQVFSYIQSDHFQPKFLQIAFRSSFLYIFVGCPGIYGWWFRNPAFTSWSW